MRLCMRTTIEIDDDVMRAVKRQAADTNRTLRAVIEDALRASLIQQKMRGELEPKEKLITFKGNGVRPGVNLDSTSELLDVMDELG